MSQCWLARSLFFLLLFGSLSQLSSSLPVSCLCARLSGPASLPLPPRLAPLSPGGLSAVSLALALGRVPTPSLSQGLKASRRSEPPPTPSSRVVAGLGLVPFQLNLAGDPLLPLT